MTVESYMPDDFQWHIFCSLAGFEVMASQRGYTTIEAAQAAADEAMRRLFAIGAKGRISS